MEARDKGWELDVIRYGLFVMGTGSKLVNLKFEIGKWEMGTTNQH